MAVEDIGLTQASIEALNRRDLDGFLGLMDPEVEVHSRIIAIEGGLHGHDGVRRWWREWFSVFPDYEIEIEEVRELGGVIVAALRALGHGAGSNVPLEDVVWMAGRWRDGKAVWWRISETLEEAMESAGLDS